MGFENILRRLAMKQIIMPYLENAFHNDQWPDSYDIHVDSQAYYGLTDTEGITHDVGVGDGYFHPSSHPLMPARELYYRFHPEYASKVVGERRTLTSHMTLAVGSAMHAVIQTQLHMAGVLHMGPENDDWTKLDHEPDARGRWVPENRYEWEYVDDEHKVRGRTDGGVLEVPDLGRVLFELKTQNSRAFSFQHELKPEWDNQTQLGMEYYDVDHGVLLLLEMGYPFSFREFPLTRRKHKVEEIWAKFDYVRECIAADTPPPCEHALGTAPAGKCPVSHICWGQA